MNVLYHLELALDPAIFVTKIGGPDGCYLLEDPS